MSKKISVKAVAVTGVICALAYLLTFVFHFKVSFLTFDFKDAVIALSSLIYGAPYGVAAAAIVAFVEFVSISDTGLYGLIMNFLASATFSFVCGIIYNCKRTLSGAVLGLILSSVSVVAVMLAANFFITPFYMGVPRSAVIELLPTLILPFNIVKTVINSAFTLLLYKPVINALRHYGIIEKSKQQSRSLVSVIVLIISVIVIVISALFVILQLNGVFVIF